MPSAGGRDALTSRGWLIRVVCLGPALLGVGCAGLGLGGGSDRDLPRPLPSNPIPEYSLLISNAGLAEEVTASLDVLPDGTVDSSTLVVNGGHFRDASWEALRRWRFSPAPAESPFRYRVAIRFRDGDTLRALPGEVVTLGRSRILAQDSGRIHVAAGVRAPTHGLPVVGRLEDVDQVVRDSIVSAAVLDVMEVSHFVTGRASDDYLCLGELSEGVRRRVLARYPMAIQDGCFGIEEAHVRISTGGGTEHEGGRFRVRVHLRTYSDTRERAGRSGRSGTWTCHLDRNLKGRWEPVCLSPSSFGVWVA